MKYVKMRLSKNGFANFKKIMKKMQFKNADLFLRYCVLKTIRPIVSKSQRKQVNKEIKLLIKYRNLI